MRDRLPGTSQRRHGPEIGVLLGATAGLLVAVAVVGSGAPVHPWSSEQMMQTLPARELRDAPLRSLLYLHKQPPGLDAIRAVLAVLAPDGADLGRFVDTGLQRLWAVVYGLTGALVCAWIRRTSTTPVAVTTAVVWLLHPAAIAYATFLESTALSALLLLWLFVELRDAPTSRRAAIRLAAAVVLLVYTRTVFQWYFVPVLAAALWLRGVPARRGLAVVAAVGALTGALVAKQAVLFGTTSTSTFTGHHHCGVLWHAPTLVERLDRARALAFAYPDGATSRDPENGPVAAVDNLVLSQLCGEWALAHPEAAMRAVGRSLAQNVRVFLQPSSRYTGNRLVDALPWRVAYDLAFSGWRLVALLAVAAAIQLASLRGAARPLATLRGRSAYALVFGYVLVVTVLGNRAGWVEADRLKFLLEPAFFAFVASSLAAAPGVVARWRAAPPTRGSACGGAAGSGA